MTSTAVISGLQQLGYARYDLASTLDVSPADARLRGLTAEFDQLPSFAQTWAQAQLPAVVAAAALFPWFPVEGSVRIFRPRTQTVLVAMHYRTWKGAGSSGCGAWVRPWWRVAGARVIGRGIVQCPPCPMLMCPL